MNIMQQLDSAKDWHEFYEYKCSGGHMPLAEKEELNKFIEQREYLGLVDNINKGIPFSHPQKKTINKLRTNKKRIVYTFQREESFLLKYVSFLLHKYDKQMADNLYSFRRDWCVKKAFLFIREISEIDERYIYKIDISNYFNSVDVDILLELMQDLLLEEDSKLLDFISGLLRDSYVIENGALVEEKKGIMAGTPISAFLANVYLMEMDYYFQDRNIDYARYSDDIIVFCRNEKELTQVIDYIDRIFEKYHLQINQEKKKIVMPYEKWDFLGVSYHEGSFDISEITIKKWKDKMKRKAKALVRWQRKNNAEKERAIRAFILHFNKKLFENASQHELTWCRWFFPLINSTEGLKSIDQYMQSCIRYIATGRHSKSNYRLRYDDMKKYGYINLVNHYYHWREAE